MPHNYGAPPGWRPATTPAGQSWPPPEQQQPWGVPAPQEGTNGSTPRETHDAEDGCWQFLDGGHVSEHDATAVLLGEMAQFDPSLVELADLPAGSYAWRAAPGRPWCRAGGEPPVTLPTCAD